MLWDRAELERFESDSSRLQVTSMTHHHVEQSNSIFFAYHAIGPAYQRTFAVVAKYLYSAHVPTRRKQYATDSRQNTAGNCLRRRESQTVGSLHLPPHVIDSNTAVFAACVIILIRQPIRPPLPCLCDIRTTGIPDSDPLIS
jgi:hypothetical protein